MRRSLWFWQHCVFPYFMSLSLCGLSGMKTTRRLKSDWKCCNRRLRIRGRQENEGEVNLLSKEDYRLTRRDSAQTMERVSQLHLVTTAIPALISNEEVLSWERETKLQETSLTCLLLSTITMSRDGLLCSLSSVTMNALQFAVNLSIYWSLCHYSIFLTSPFLRI